MINPQKSFIQIATRYFHNDRIKPPSEDGFSDEILESGDVIIGDKQLRKIYTS